MGRFDPNPQLDAELERDPEFRAAMRGEATEVKAAADLIARTMPDGGAWMPRPGRETFEVDEDATGVAVVNTDHAAALQEWGGKTSPPWAPLRRAARAAGLKLK